jgi:hypothetical protein
VARTAVFPQYQTSKHPEKRGLSVEEIERTRTKYLNTRKLQIDRQLIIVKLRQEGTLPATTIAQAETAQLSKEPSVDC